MRRGLFFVRAQLLVVFIVRGWHLLLGAQLDVVLYLRGGQLDNIDRCELVLSLRSGLLFKLNVERLRCLPRQLELGRG
jgi:hypothetical protein